MAAAKALLLLAFLSVTLGTTFEATSAHAQHFEPRLKLPPLALMQLEPLDAQPGPVVAPSSASPNLQGITGGPSRGATVTVGSVSSTVVVSLGASLALAGGFHVLRAHDRAQGCHYPEDKAPREAEQRRAGWAIAAVGTGMVVTTLGVWVVQRARGIAPPFTRAMRWIAATSPLVGGAVASALLWGGMTVRSIGCYNS